MSNNPTWFVYALYDHKETCDNFDTWQAASDCFHRKILNDFKVMELTMYRDGELSMEWKRNILQ